MPANRSVLEYPSVTYDSDNAPTRVTPAAEPRAGLEPKPVERAHRQLNLPFPGLIEKPPHGMSINRQDRVYANRNVHLGAIQWIGFDMDYTLAIYRQDAMDTLSVRLTAERLVQRGYPEFLTNLDFDTQFPIRGLLVDKELGNILKLDRHKAVQLGFHGTRQLSKKELIDLYHHEKLRPESSRFHWIDTLFALCEVTSYAAIISALEERKHAFDPRQLFIDVRAAIDQAHAEGVVYKHVTDDLERYVDKDAALPKTLHKLRSAGKRLFMLTNSPYHYTDSIMSYLLAADPAHYQNWTQYFDVIVCSAKKPLWFRYPNQGEDLPFLRRTNDLPARAAADSLATGPFERGVIYEGGNLLGFESRLKISGPEVLYVGDHIYGDILRSKKDSNWRTALIVQELDQEIRALTATDPLRVRRRQLAEARPFFEDELRYYAAKFKEVAKSSARQTPDEKLTRERAKGHIDRVRAELTQLEHEYEQVEGQINRAFHPYWGSLLKEMNGLSIFGKQVDLYADIYMRRVSSLGIYSPTQFFRSPHDLMPHEI